MGRVIVVVMGVGFVGAVMVGVVACSSNFTPSTSTVEDGINRFAAW